MSQAYKNSDRLELWASLLSIMARSARMVEDMAEVLQAVWPFPESAAGFDPWDWPDVWDLFPGQAWETPVGVMLPWGEPAISARRYRELEERCAAQQEKIAELRRALADRDPEVTQIQRRFEEILKTQADQFEQLMSSFTKFFGTTRVPSDRAVSVGSDEAPETTGRTEPQSRQD